MASVFIRDGRGETQREGEGAAGGRAETVAVPLQEEEHGGRPAAPQAGGTRSGLSSESRWLSVVDTLTLDLWLLEPPICGHLLGEP